MIHKINFDKTAKLIRADTVAQFGEGYRQITGSIIAKGSVIELLEKALTAPAHERSKLFIGNETGNPLTVDEVRTQAEAGGFSVGGG